MSRSLSSMNLVIGLLFVLIGVGFFLANMKGTEFVGAVIATGAGLVAWFILNQRNSLP